MYDVFIGVLDFWLEQTVLPPSPLCVFSRREGLRQAPRRALPRCTLHKY